MKRIPTAYVISLFLIIACTTKSPSLTDQLKANFSSHLQRTDSSLVLDSFTIIRIDTANQRLFNAVQDTSYKITLHKVQSQLANATAIHKTDSMAFYQEELNYMLPTSDSLAKLVPLSDTTKKYGILVACRVQVSKGVQIVRDNIYYYLNLDMTAMNLDWIDGEASRLSDQLNAKIK